MKRQTAVVLGAVVLVSAVFIGTKIESGATRPEKASVVVTAPEPAENTVSASSPALRSGLLAAGKIATPGQAQAFVDRATLYIREVGLEAALCAFSAPTFTKEDLSGISKADLEHKKSLDCKGNRDNTDWRDRDLYVYVYDYDGTVLAHGVNSSMIGQNLYALRDAKGKALIRGLIDEARKKTDSGDVNQAPALIDFVWLSPVTGEYQRKDNFVRDIKEHKVVVGVGFYPEDEK